MSKLKPIACRDEHARAAGLERLERFRELRRACAAMLATSRSRRSVALAELCLAAFRLRGFCPFPSATIHFSVGLARGCLCLGARLPGFHSRPLTPCVREIQVFLVALRVTGLLFLNFNCDRPASVNLFPHFSKLRGVWDNRIELKRDHGRVLFEDRETRFLVLGVDRLRVTVAEFHKGALRISRRA